MSLIKLSSDRGQGYTHDPVFLKANAIVAVTGDAGQNIRSDNKTIVTLETGDKFGVRESIYEVNRQINLVLSPKLPKSENPDPAA